ncbi:MAG TPA: exodeoxyribonuclease VII small subunit [Gemmatimonadaceae bacterium]|jgi:exodeoxyribonuclease VII small subunit
MTFEKRLARLEAIAAELESGELELARALALFEEGVEQLRAAADELAQAETRVQTLIERADGTFDLSEPRE